MLRKGIQGLFGLAMILLVAGGSPLQAQDFNLGVLSNSLVSGDYSSIAFQDDYAFIATEYGFKVLDISDRGYPVELVHVPTPGIANYVVCRDDLLFVCDVDEGLEVYDLTDIYNPVMSDCIELQGHIRAAYPHESENYVYVAMEDYGLQIVDFTDPSNLQLMEVCYVGGEIVQPLIMDEWLYLTQGPAGLGVYDITDPLNPDCALIWNTQGGIMRGMHIFEGGERMAVADEANGIYLLDLEFPWVPTWTSTVTHDDLVAFSVTGGSDYGIGCYYREGIQSFDMDGDELDFYPLGKKTGAAKVIDDYAYVCAADTGLFVFDSSDPTNLQLESEIINPFTVTGVTVFGDVAYVTNNLDGLTVLDVSDPTDPEVVTTISLGGRVSGINPGPDEGYLYVTDFTNGLNVFDVSDPFHPNLINTVPTLPDTGANNVGYSDGYLYVAVWDVGPNVFDISDPTNPVMTWSSPDTTEWFAGITISPDGQFLYSCAWASDILIYSIPGDGTLEYLYTYDEVWVPRGMMIQGDYGYISDVVYGLYVLDISNPYYIFKTDSIAHQSEIKGTSPVVDGVVAMADWAAGVALIDVSDPYNLEEITRYNTSGRALGGQTVGSNLFFADSYSLTVFDLYAAGIADPGGGTGTIPESITLHPAYPNPFNSTTMLSFDIHQAGRVTIEVFNLKGEKVASVFDARVRPGQHTATFHAPDLASGVYFAKLRMNLTEQVQKLLYVK